MADTAEYIVNPYTGRKVKIGSRKYRDLINTGAIAPEYESDSDIELDDLDWNKAQPEEDEPEEDEPEEEEVTEEDPVIEEDEFQDLNENDLSKIKDYVNYLRSNKK